MIHLQNSYTTSRISHGNYYTPYLVYGKLPNKLKRNALDFVQRIGFLNTDNYIHPSPKDELLWTRILSEIKPSSVLDPFMGSGTTMEACLQLGIPCIGYELMERRYRLTMIAAGGLTVPVAGYPSTRLICTSESMRSKYDADMTPNIRDWK